MKSVLRSVALAAILSLGGCALFHHEDPFMQIQPGMEAAQVESLLGSPVDRKFVADHDEWTYRKDMGNRTQKTKVIVFDNKKVVALADDAVSAEREFELAKARAGANQYVPGVTTTANGQTTTAPGTIAPMPTFNPLSGSAMVLPPTAAANPSPVAPVAAVPAAPPVPPAPPVAVAPPAPNPAQGVSSAAPVPARPVGPVVPPSSDLTATSKEATDTFTGETPKKHTRHIAKKAKKHVKRATNKAVPPSDANSR